MEGQIADHFEQLWTNTRPELLRYYERRLPNPAEAEDAVQSLFEQLLKVRGEITSPLALIRTMAARLLADAYDAQRVAPEPLSYEKLIGLDGTGLDHLPQFQTASFDDLMFDGAHDTAVRDLADDLRDAYILGELRGLPSRESGQVLGVSHVTAATRRELATTVIREEIA
jgi:DNA-directed RNA polymerase specialized sigma24 family protein